MSSPNSASIKVEDLSVRLGRKPLDRKQDSDQFRVKDLNFSCHVGEISSIIGPNGCGKSTLIQCLIEDLNYSGNVHIPELSSVRVERARQLAYLPQYSELNFPYSVREVVELARIPHRSGRQIDNQVVNDVIQLIGLSHLKHADYTKLSGGEQRRTQIARVLAQIWRADDCDKKNRYLILDEPTQSLDVHHQKQLMQILSKLVQQKVCVIFSTHQLNWAAQYADQIIALAKGKIIGCGTPTQVLTAKNLKSIFDLDAIITEHPEKMGVPLVNF